MKIKGIVIFGRSARDHIAIVARFGVIFDTPYFQDDNEISITDAQSLDRLSLHSQEDLDEINFEKYLQSAGRAAGWAKEFDGLLSDKIGLSMFTEFLQKEFSHENIYFWCA